MKRLLFAMSSQQPFNINTVSAVLIITHVAFTNVQQQNIANKIYIDTYADKRVGLNIE